MNREKDLGAEPTPNNRVDLSPPTFLQNLRGLASNTLKDMGGFAAQLGIYITEFVMIHGLTYAAGLSPEYRFIIPVYSTVALIPLQQLVVFPRLEKRLPWLKTNRSLN